MSSLDVDHDEYIDVEETSDSRLELVPIEGIWNAT